MVAETKDFAHNTTTPVDSVVPLGWIRPSRLNPRTRFDAAELAELAASIKANGLLEPIVVREITPDASSLAHLEIVAGERRYRACKIADVVTVPVRNLGPLDDATALRLALVENLQRADLDPIEEAEGYRALHDLAGLTQAAIAAALHRSQPQVANRLRLLELPDSVRELLRAGKLSAAHGVQLARFAPFPELCAHLAEAALTRPLTSKQLQGDAIDLLGYGSTLIRRFYDAHFDRAICESCPFDAYRAAGGGACLKPAHFEELNAAEQERRRAELEAARAARPDDGAPPFIPRGQMRFDTCTLIHGTPPAGCTEACPCRGRAEDYDGRVVPCCLDPARHDGLARAAREKEDADRHARKAELLAALEERLAALAGVGPRELTLLVARALSYADSRGVAAAFKRQKATPPAKGEIRDAHLAELAEVSPAVLLRVAVDAIVRRDLANWGGSYNPPRLAEWYLARREVPDA